MAGRTPKNQQKGKAFDSEAALLFYIKEVVKRRGITHQQLADKVKIDRPQITRILSGQKTPTLASFFKIVDALGIRVRVDTQDLGLFEMGFNPQNWVYPEGESDTGSGETKTSTKNC